VFPKLLTQYSGILQEGNSVLVRATVSLREDREPELLLNGVEMLDQALQTASNKAAVQGKKAPVLYIRVPSNTPELFGQVKSALAPFRGDFEVRVYFEDTKKTVRVPRDLYYNGSASAVRELKYAFGDDNVAIKR
jgi:DNA polymerase-3 subunit alpha